MKSVFTWSIRVVLAMSVSMTLSSCSPNPNTTSNIPTPTTSDLTESEEKQIIDEFGIHVKEQRSAQELHSFVQEKIPRLSPESADELIRMLLAYYEGELPLIEKKFDDEQVQSTLQGMNDMITINSVPDIDHSKTKELLELTFSSGFIVDTTEGYFFPIVNYEALKEFDEYVTPTIKDYIALLALESNSKSTSDGGLVIPWNELAARTLTAESFIRDHPSAQERERVEERYIQYLNNYLIGLNNSPIFDYDTFKILPEVKAMYENTTQSYPDTVTAILTKQLLSVLAITNDQLFLAGDGGNQVDIPETKQFRESIESEARQQLGTLYPAKEEENR